MIGNVPGNQGILTQDQICEQLGTCGKKKKKKSKKKGGSNVDGPRPKKKVKAVDYDERIHRKGHPPHRTRNALILIALVVVGSYLAVTKSLPFGSEYEVKAMFANAANVRQGSPVRIAGVNVGEVKGVRSVGDAAEVTITVDEEGRPLHEDAQAEIRPRIFLEGNFFVDVQPGQPERSRARRRRRRSRSRGPRRRSSSTRSSRRSRHPSARTCSACCRATAQALNYAPTAADDKGHDPIVQGRDGRRGHQRRVRLRRRPPPATARS